MLTRFALCLLLACSLCMAICAAAVPTPAQPPLPKTKINPKDGAAMVLIPAGSFLMGTSEAQLATMLKAHPAYKRERYTHEMPQHPVYLDAYYLYKNDVTVAEYRTFCTATGRKMPAAPDWGWIDTHPMVNVSWTDAKAYSDWAGVVLPTEAQWEKAARGTDGRVYPWGNDWDAAKCSNSVGATHPGKTSPVGAFPAGASPYGCLDMAGNVWQWCADWYGADYYTTSPAKNPTGPSTGTGRVLRGGSWMYDIGLACIYFRGADRDYNNPLGYWDSDLGFRCVSLSPGP